MTDMTRRGVRTRTVAVLILAALVFSSCRYTSQIRLPDDLAVSSRILWNDGTLLTRVHGVEDRDPISLDEMAPTLPKAVIAIEDANFYGHGGVEIRGIVRALTHNLEQGKAAEGGSTITQQYIRAVLLGNEKTVKRKLREAVMATQLEQRYSKRTILERYLNTVYFGNGAYGVQAAARTYFGIDASAIDLAQSALLAGMIRSPGEYDPYTQLDAALARRNEVIERMRALRRITEDEALVATVAPIAVEQLVDDRQYPAPFFVEKVKQFIFNDERFGATKADRERALFQGGLTIETTLDKTWQIEAHTALKGVLTDPADPPVLSWPWTRRTATSRPTRAARTTGVRSPTPSSTSPPRNASPGAASNRSPWQRRSNGGSPSTRSYSGGSPRTIPTPGGPWRLENFEGQGFGRMNLMEATVNSVNTVYGQLVMDAGPENVALLATQMGITSPLPALPAIAIGDLEVSVTDLASAYSVFAADGIRHSQVFVTRVTDRQGRVVYQAKQPDKRVLAADTARTVTGALQQVVQRGTAVKARIGRPAAGKTGTTDNRKDAWFAGYTNEVVAVAWVGFPDGTPMIAPRTRRPGLGGEWPAQIWQVFTSSVLANVPASLFPVPEGTTTTTTTVPRSATTRPAVPGIVSVVGVDAFTAVQTLQARGFRVETVGRPSRRYPPGTVISQDPIAGMQVRPGATVTLTVASGRPRVITVPNLLGLLSDQAAGAIRDAGFVADIVVEVQPSPVPPNSQGKVWQQSPSSGTRLDEGSTVRVWTNP